MHALHNAQQKLNRSCDMGVYAPGVFTSGNKVTCPVYSTFCPQWVYFSVPEGVTRSTHAAWMATGGTGSAEYQVPVGGQTTAQTANAQSNSPTNTPSSAPSRSPTRTSTVDYMYQITLAGLSASNWDGTAETNFKITVRHNPQSPRSAA